MTNGKGSAYNKFCAGKVAAYTGINGAYETKYSFSDTEGKRAKIEWQRPFDVSSDITMTLSAEN